MKKYADIHSHCTLKAINYHRVEPDNKKASLWYQDKPKRRQRDNDLVRYTQSDFSTLAKGNVKIIFVSLYPIEQGWFASRSTGLLVDFLAMYATEFPIKRINQIQSDSYNYFEELQKEYQFLVDEIKLPRNIKIEDENKNIWAKMPINKSELEKFLNEDETIIIIPTVEGANSLISGNSKNPANFNLQQTLHNIDIIKNWSTPPFFLTLSHHFFNGMTGHARSIFGKNKFQEIIENVLLNQTEGISSGITEKGWAVIRKLLSVEEFKNSGKRILIDTKHLNAYSRKQFYNYILQHNEQNPDDKIPLINSHCAYNNKKTIANTLKTDALDTHVFSDSEVFNEAEINITDEDVSIIYQTNGLIGINLDERILSSKKVIDNAKKEFNHNAIPELRLYWAKQIVRNITAMVEVMMEDDRITDISHIWDVFSIGSDFDGFINPVDAFITAEEFNFLEYYLIQAFSTDELFKKYNNGLTSEQVVTKFMYKNSYDFLMKHYWNEEIIS